MHCSAGAGTPGLSGQVLFFILVAFRNVLAWLVFVLSVSGVTPPPAVHADAVAVSEVGASQAPVASDFIWAPRSAGERNVTRGSGRIVAARSHHVYIGLASTLYGVSRIQPTTALIERGSALRSGLSRITLALRGPPSTL